MADKAQRYCTHDQRWPGQLAPFSRGQIEIVLTLRLIQASMNFENVDSFHPKSSQSPLPPGSLPDIFDRSCMLPSFTGDRQLQCLKANA